MLQPKDCKWSICTIIQFLQPYSSSFSRPLQKLINTYLVASFCNAIAVWFCFYPHWMSYTRLIDARHGFPAQSSNILPLILMEGYQLMRQKLLIWSELSAQRTQGSDQKTNGGWSVCNIWEELSLVWQDFLSRCNLSGIAMQLKASCYQCWSTNQILPMYGRMNIIQRNKTKSQRSSQKSINLLDIWREPWLISCTPSERDQVWPQAAGCKTSSDTQAMHPKWLSNFTSWHWPKHLSNGRTAQKRQYRHCNETIIARA